VSPCGGAGGVSGGTGGGDGAGGVLGAAGGVEVPTLFTLQHRFGGGG